MKKKVIKGLILVGFLLIGASMGFNSKEEGNSRVPSAAVDFKLNSSHDKLHGGFKNAEVKVSPNKIKGEIVLKSMWSSKPEKRDDLLDYFEASDYPKAKFEVQRKGNKLEGKGKIKGENFKLTGEIKENKALIRLQLKKLIGGFKSNFIDAKDNVEMIIDLKK